LGLARLSRHGAVAEQNVTAASSLTAVSRTLNMMWAKELEEQDK
jgi:hypothetical protein